MIMQLLLGLVILSMTYDAAVTVSLVPANWGRLCLRTILDLKNMCILQLKTGVPAYQQERVR